uniref:Cytochrome P450 n=1 Tax=Oryza barthii TaxID=65489 RepID=A0A0D3G9R6_9ORYZ
MAAVQLDSGLLVGFLFLATCLAVAVRSYLRSGGAAIPSPPAHGHNIKSIEWTMAELIKNPAEMAKVQAEVRHVAAAAHGDEDEDTVAVIREEQLGKMTLLRAAMKEAMRLHPPVPLLIPREAIEDTVLHGHRVAAGTRVMINAWAIGRDEAAWEGAAEFRPGRFAGGGDAAGVEYYGGGDFRFVPFGAGRRGCPGVAFGTRLAELAVANMACWFEWELPDGQDVESFEVVESSGLSPGLINPLEWLSLTWSAF